MAIVMNEEAFGNLTDEQIQTLADMLKGIKEYKTIQQLLQENKELKSRLKKIEEYITSYESISTIQGLNDTKENKNLDKNTMVKMTNRYLKIHDKILSIIKGDE